jgi:hypothetical protein
VYRIKADPATNTVRFRLDGVIHDEEMKKFLDELRAATLSVAGRPIKILADVRAFRPASPQGTEMIRNVQLFGLEHGVARVAEVVDSQTVALQLNRIAQESGTDKILRRFWDEESAVNWLAHEDSRKA